MTEATPDRRTLYRSHQWQRAVDEVERPAVETGEGFGGGRLGRREVEACAEVATLRTEHDGPIVTLVCPGDALDDGVQQRDVEEVGRRTVPLDLGDAGPDVADGDLAEIPGRPGCSVSARRAHGARQCRSAAVAFFAGSVPRTDRREPFGKVEVQLAEQVQQGRLDIQQWRPAEADRQCNPTDSVTRPTEEQP